MWFCPLDGTLLMVRMFIAGAGAGGARVVCSTSDLCSTHASSRVSHHLFALPSSLYNNQIGPQPDGMGNNYHFYCSTCPYTCPMDGKNGQQQRYSATTACQRKPVDDILGGAAAWENKPRTQAVCPSCHHDSAYFQQIQIRSADEPMSVFYKCVQCGHQWNDK